jgi:hypothetical protein
MVVIVPTWEMVAINVINQLIGATTKLNVIAKICKHRRLHEGSFARTCESLDQNCQDSK